MRELFLSYIGSPWFFTENRPMNVMGPINIVSMLAMAFLNIKMRNINHSNWLTFLYVHVGCSVIAFCLYGYLAIPACILWIREVKTITIDRVKYYYIRDSYGHTGGWHAPSFLDNTLDYDEIIDEIEFDKDKMSKFYSSDIPMYLGVLSTIIELIICMFIYKGYCFFP